MIAILAPAITMADNAPPLPGAPTQPQFLPEAAELVAMLRPLSVPDLAHLMQISDELAALNAARYANWQIAHTPDRRPGTADGRPGTADRRPQTRDRRPRTGMPFLQRRRSSAVGGHSSAVSRRRSLIGGHSSAVTHRRSAVGGRRSLIGGRSSFSTEQKMPKRFCGYRLRAANRAPKNAAATGGGNGLFFDMTFLFMLCYVVRLRREKRRGYKAISFSDVNMPYTKL